MAGSRRGFGAIRKLPSGRWQASFAGPDGRRTTAPTTFQAKIDAETWLGKRREEIRDGTWRPRRKDPAPVPTLSTYAARWLAARDLKPSTRYHYRRLLDVHILPTLGSERMHEVTAEAVNQWRADFREDIPTMRAHAYALLRTIFNTAMDADADSDAPGMYVPQVMANPCTSKKASRVKRRSETTDITPAEIAALVEKMPDRWKAATLVAAWGALRFGELFALERRDVDVTAGVVHVRRAITRVEGKVIVGDPKSEAGKRTVHLPPHVLDAVRHQLDTYAEKGRTGLVFPAIRGGYVNPATLQHAFYPARRAIDREDLRWHDLRHFGATEAARAGATLVELKARIGHGSTTAALRYQRAAESRDAELAKRMSERAGG